MLGCESDPNSRQRNIRRAALYAALIGILLAPSLSQAVEYSSARKAGRGLAGMTTCFLEIPGNMVEQSRKHGAGAGIPLGFVFGLGKIVVRVLVGTYELVSAPFEAPDGFVPIIEPEFPWSYFDEQPASSRSN
jgi:putative exosortase-associated protein (TIGR04073 family)